MLQPLVSIIVPTYNVEKYVEECLDSLLNQTYQNIEIIVLDDASTDATLYLLKKYAILIKLIENKSNKGQGTRRNEGIKIARGEYILFIDADDWIESNTVEELVKTLTKTNVDLIRFNGKSFYEGGSITVKQPKYNFSDVLESERVYKGAELLNYNKRSYSASPCLYLTKKEVIDRYNLEFLEGVMHEDEYYTTCLFVSISSMIYINQTFYHRRYRISSTMTEQSTEHKLKSYNSYFKVFRALEEEYYRLERTTEEKKFIKRQLLSIYHNLSVSTVPHENKKNLKCIKSISLKDKMMLQLITIRNKLKTND